MLGFKPRTRGDGSDHPVNFAKTIAWRSLNPLETLYLRRTSRLYNYQRGWARLTLASKQHQDAQSIPMLAGPGVPKQSPIQGLSRVIGGLTSVFLWELVFPIG